MGCVDPARDRELGGSDGEAAHAGFHDALKGAHLAQIDVGALQGELAVGNEVQLTLPGAGDLDLVTDRVDRLLPGLTTFTGHLPGDDGSDFTFSIEAGKLVGSIRQGTQAWLVEPHATSTQHVVRTIDRAMLPKSEVEHPSSLHRISTTSTVIDHLQVNPATLSNGEVRVLFLIASDVGNGSSHAANIVSSFNNSLGLSAVLPNNFLTLAGVQSVASNFDNLTRDQIRNMMNQRAAPFGNINAQMAAVHADIAFLLVSEDPDVNTWPDFAPWGRVGGVANIFEQPNPFALSTVNYALGDLTALHEIGHVFGGHHETNAATTARGYVLPGGGSMTVMGGYNSTNCRFNGLQQPTCVRLNRWSNPDQTFNGVALGVAGQHDMESHLEGAMPTVSNWGAEPPANAPAAMTSPPPGSQLPGATVNFSWSTGVGVTYYYLYVGNSPGNNDIYSAGFPSATSTTVGNIPTDGRTIYVRLWSLIGGGWQFNDYAYTASSAPVPAWMTSPAPGSQLPGASVTFYWSTGTGVQQYYLYVGNSAGSGDIYAASQGTSTARTLNGLPTDGRTLYVRLWSYTNLGWQFRDYTYTAASSCHYLNGQHGQLWTTVSANSQYVYNGGWCSVGRGLPEQCWEGTYYYYQDVQSSYCSSTGSSGSCYDGDAWWWVTCNALVDCIYNCSGQCIQSSC